MNHICFQRFRADCTYLLLTMALPALFGCGRQSDAPMPPHSPPRPMTSESVKPSIGSEPPAMSPAALQRFM